MKPPCEIVVKILLPAIRSLVARELAYSYGWTQTKIAKFLGVTQAAVSGYLSAKPEELIIPPFSLEELVPIAKSLAAEAVMRRVSTVDSISNICKICLGMRREGTICHYHKEKVPELREENCIICLHLHLSLAEVSDARKAVLNEVKSAALMLEAEPEVVNVIPEVFSNIAMALSEARSIADVAAIPGRIAKVRGRVKAMMHPEFGASLHLAAILLSIMEKDRDTRAIMNIKYDHYVETALRKARMSYVKMRRDRLPEEALKSGDPVAWFASKIVEERGKAPDAIIDEGAYGIEPVTYLLDEKATKVAEKAIRIARMVAQMKAPVSVL
ncbi:MAG: hypothetical protein DRJ33_00340 [Candidatus Methanomethylicota archaeon]|uniref:Thiamine-phosphate synthase ThiN domain-containing protein n=1 Tax=Thermoproteota archaeon TaxID=2056631 RepID=A0A497F439_9CREN|nr:MAG: hypothetical protein DRJ33_00340 [Candidatus Verstraetearchaeota archaeon]